MITQRRAQPTFSLRTFTGVLAAVLLGSGCATGKAPVGVEELSSMGYRKLQLRDSAGALSTFDSAVAIEANAKVQAGRGRALAQMGQLPKARAAFQEAIRMEPAETEWRLGLSVIELRAGDMGAAIAACDEAIRIDARSSKAHYNRGSALLTAGSVDEAIAAFETATRWNPSFARAHNSLGVALARSGQPETAIEHFRYASSSGVLPEAHANCAAIYHSIGETKLALQELNAALRITGTDVNYLLNRAQIYLDLKQPELASKDLEDAQGLAPTHPRVVRMVQTLRDEGSTMHPRAHEFSAGR